MWSRSAKSKETGKFAVECIDWNGNLFFSGEFDSAHDADRAGKDAERRMTMKMMTPVDAPTMDDVFAEMDADELLAELLA